jgi:PhzF family phenazine biosynthesis protein
MKSYQTIYQVDAFTNEPFRGNPAGVCIMDHEPSAKWMQNIAMEMNLSETAFVFFREGKRNIRYYTPEAEIQLCGHATLSASHILYETGEIKGHEQIILECRAGELIIKKEGAWITMNFPSYPLTQVEVTPEFRRITGIDPVELYEAGHGWTLVLLKNEAAIRNLSPNLALMKDSKFGDLIATAVSDDPAFDFCVRCFAPALGINEDPVTGSAHCALAPFWSGRTEKKEFISHQVSKREGILKVALKGDRVDISGQAVTIFKAKLLTEDKK